MTPVKCHQHTLLLPLTPTFTRHCEAHFSFPCSIPSLDLCSAARGHRGSVLQYDTDDTTLGGSEALSQDATVTKVRRPEKARQHGVTVVFADGDGTATIPAADVPHCVVRPAVATHAPASGPRPVPKDVAVAEEETEKAGEAGDQHGQTEAEADSEMALLKARMALLEAEKASLVARAADFERQLQDEKLKTAMMITSQHPATVAPMVATSRQHPVTAAPAFATSQHPDTAAPGTAPAPTLSHTPRAPTAKPPPPVERLPAFAAAADDDNDDDDDDDDDDSDRQADTPAGGLGATSALHARPRGRAPKHSRWDPMAACWVRTRVFGRFGGRFVGGAGRTQSTAACSPNAVSKADDDDGEGSDDGDEKLANEAPGFQFDTEALQQALRTKMAAASTTPVTPFFEKQQVGRGDFDSVRIAVGMPPNVNTGHATPPPDEMHGAATGCRASVQGTDTVLPDNDAASPAAVGSVTRRQRLAAADASPWTKLRNPRTPHTASNPPHYHWNEATGLVSWDDPTNPRLAPGMTRPILATGMMKPTDTCTICAMVFYDLDAPDAVDLHVAAKHVCSDCGATGVNVAKCKRHHTSQRAVAKELAGPGVACTVCAKHFKLRRRLQIHSELQD